MKQQWKRTLAIILSVIMLLGTAGMSTAFATEGGAPPPVEDSAAIQTITGFVGFDPDAFAPLDTIEVTEKSTVDAIGLPGTLDVTLDGAEGEAAIPVTWETADGSDYGNTAFETYDFTPVWDTDTYALADGVVVPAITVFIRPQGHGRLTPRAVGEPTTLISAIDAWDPDGEGSTHTAAQVSVSWDADTSTVTVFDQLSGQSVFNATQGLELNIPAGITVKWQPSCSFSAVGLVVSGEGTFTLDSVSKLTAQSSNSQTEHTAIYNNGGNVMISSGARVQATGTANKPAIYNGGALEVSGTVTAASGNAVLNKSGAETIIKDNAVVSASGESETIRNETGCILNISGGTVSHSKDYRSVVTNFGSLTMTDGQISTDATSGKAITPVSGSSTIVSGGTIQATDEDGEIFNISGSSDSPIGAAIALTGGTFTGSTGFGNNRAKAILAYLAGTSYTPPLGELSDISGTVVEIDSLSIPASRHNTDEGITIKAEGQTWNDKLTTTAKWDTSGATPKIVVEVVDSDNTLTYTASMDWGTKTTSGGDNDTSAPTVLSVTPSGTGAPLSGDVVVTFSEPIANEAQGGCTVQYEGGSAGTMGTRSWNADKTVLTVGYSGLEFNTQYTILIDSFKDAVGNTMNRDASHKFTTMASAATTHAVTVNGGTGSGSYAEGQAVTITANAAPGGQRFKEWSISPEVTFVEGTKKTNQTAKFTMPARAVNATAAYESIPTGATAVTGVRLNQTSLSLYSNATPNTATLTATVSPANATDKTMTWASGNTAVATVDQSGKVTAVGNGTATITVTTIDGGYAANCTVSVSAYSSGGGTGGGSSGGGGGSSPGGGGSPSGGGTTTVTPADPDKPDTAINAETKVTPTVGADGKATVTVPENSVTDAIQAAQDAAKKAGTEKNGVSVTIDATTNEGASDITATLPAKSVDDLITAGVTEVRIKSDAATITLDLAALKAAQAVAGGKVTVSAKPVAANTLSAEAQTAIGNRPVFSFTLQSGGKGVTDFGGGIVSAAIPYTLGANEKAEDVQAVYVDDSGQVTWIADSSYDMDSKAILFSTGHFSAFGVGYRDDAPVFTDITDHWAKNAIEFVAARGLLSGTGNHQFSPDTGMTRGMFVTALGRLAGIDPAGYKTGKFTDVKADAYYAAYVNWAAEKGIVSGTGETTFAPDQAVTRQEMAVIMANYAKALGYTIPKTREAVIFADNADIASWAKDASQAMQMAGIIQGRDGNEFDPAGTATRAEVAAVFHRYVELVIDPDGA